MYNYGPPGPAPAGWPQVQQPRAEDLQHLETLAICHFIYAGFLGLAGLGGLLYVVLGIVFATAIATGAGGSGAAPAAAFGGIFAVIGGFIMLLLWAKAGCVIYSGLGLKRRRRRTFSFVVACIECIAVPFGTLLGVFTLMVLSRPSVQALYDQVERGG